MNSKVYSKYTNFGIGGEIFHEAYGRSHNFGIKAAGAYHLRLSENSLSHLSIGASINGVYSLFDSTTIDNPEASVILQKSFNPNFDIGVYYYGPNLFAGISSTNLLYKEASDSINSYVPTQRLYQFFGGFKIVLYKPMNIVIEPSVYVTASDSSVSDLISNMRPMLKLYIDNFCLGTYMYDWDKLSFFFQYNYRKFYIGTFIAIHRESPYYKQQPTVEVSAGINLSSFKKKARNNYHW